MGFFNHETDQHNQQSQHQNELSTIFQRPEWTNSPMFINFVAGGCAAALAAGLFNPLDSLRVRWQMERNASEASLRDFTLQILRHEGLSLGLWRPGIIAGMTGAAIASGIRFGSYEKIRDTLMTEEKKGWHIATAGLACGAFAYFVTTPLYFVKTRLQARAGTNTHDRSISSELFKKESNVDNFQRAYRGSFPSAVRGSCFSAGQMLGYDGLKTFAKKNGYEDGPALHVVSSVSASFCASFVSAPADYITAKVMNEKKGPMDCIRKIYKEEGIRGFWKGWGIFFVRVTPVLLTYTTVYEQLRSILGIGFMD